MGIKSKYRDLSKNTLLFTISSFGSKIISFLLVPLYTYVLSTGDYGTIDLMTTTVQLLIPILTINIQDAVLRFSLDDGYDKRDVIGAGLKIIISSSVLLAIALYVVEQEGIFNLEPRYLYFLFLSYLFGTTNNCFSMYLRARNRVYILTISGLMNTILTCIFNIVLLLWVKMGVTGYLIANVAGTGISIVFMLFAGNIYKEVRLENSNRILKVMIPYSLPLVVNSLAWWLNNASDRYILTFFCGVAVNGMYAVAYKIPSMLATVQNVFYNAWSISAITEFDKDDKDGFIGNVYMIYSTASHLGCTMLLICNIFIAKILYSNNFLGAWRYIPFLLTGTVFNGIALFEGCIFTAVKRTKIVSRTTIMGAVVNTFLNFALIPVIGATGAALATMAGYCSIWIVRTVQLKKIVKIKVNWSTQIASSVLLVIQSLFSMTEHLYWVQIIPAFLILMLQRKYIFRVGCVVLSKIFKH